MGRPLHPTIFEGLDNAVDGAPAQSPVRPPAPARGLPFFPTLSREDAIINAFPGGFPGTFPVDMPAGGYQNPFVSDTAHGAFIRAPPSTRIFSPVLIAGAFPGTFPIGMTASGYRTPFVSNTADRAFRAFIRAPPSTHVSSPVSTVGASASTSPSVVDWEARYNAANRALFRRTQQRDIANLRIQSLNRELHDQESELAARNRGIAEAQANFARAAEWVRVYHERVRWMKTLLAQQDRELTAANQRIAALLSQQDSELTSANQRIAALVDEKNQHFNEMVDSQLEVSRLKRERETETREREKAAYAVRKLFLDSRSEMEMRIERAMEPVVSEPLRGNEKDAEEDYADVEEDSEETTEKDEAISSGYVDLGPDGAWSE